MIHTSIYPANTKRKKDCHTARDFIFTLEMAAELWCFQVQNNTNQTFLASTCTKRTPCLYMCACVRCVDAMILCAIISNQRNSMFHAQIQTLLLKIILCASLNYKMGRPSKQNVFIIRKSKACVLFTSPFMHRSPNIMSYLTVSFTQEGYFRIFFSTATSALITCTT